MHIGKRPPCAWVLHINFAALQFTYITNCRPAALHTMEYLWLVTIPIALSWSLCCCYTTVSAPYLYNAPEVWNGDCERCSERRVWGIGRGLFEDAFPPLSWRVWGHREPLSWRAWGHREPLSWRVWGHREPLSKNSWTETKFLSHRVLR